MMYVTKRSGCLRARTSSASRPRSAVGACRYKASACSPDRRLPARTRSASSVMDSMREAHRPVGRHEPELGRITIKRLQPLDLRLAEGVLNIIAQIGTDDLLPRRITGTMRRRDVVDVRRRHRGGALSR